MRNHPLYKKLKQIVLDGNYTIEQVRDATYNQVVELLGERGFGNAFLTNMKRLLIIEMQEVQDEDNMQQLKQTAKNWLDTNFPDWVAEKGREDDKPFITIWLKGKPVTD